MVNFARKILKLSLPATAALLLAACVNNGGNAAVPATKYFEDENSIIDVLAKEFAGTHIPANAFQTKIVKGSNAPKVARWADERTYKHPSDERAKIFISAAIDFLQKGVPVNDKINSELFNIFINDGLPERIFLRADKKTTAIDACFEGRCQKISENFFKKMSENFEDFGHDFSGIKEYENGRAIRLIFADENTIVFALRDYEFSGGAHGIFTTKLYNFDAKTGELIAAGTLFKPSAKLEIERQLAHAWLMKSTLSAEETRAIKPVFTDNFALAGTSVIFYYNPYEIAPYSTGPITIELPLSDLQSVINR